METDPNQFSQPAGSVNRFYLMRFRFYAGVLVFIIGVGLPLIAVPSLRHRLGGRLTQLKQAAQGNSIPESVVAQVGQNPEPFPAQYEKPIVIPQKPPVLSFTQGSLQVLPQGTAKVVPQARAKAAPQPPALAEPRRKRELRIPTGIPGEAETQPPVQPAVETDTNLEPEFRQGEIEKEAYNLVLQKNPTLAGMVTGNNPSLQFKSWAAAKRDEDTYWVRLLFQQAQDHMEVAYIFEVKISAKQATPLNYNARSLPKS